MKTYKTNQILYKLEAQEEAQESKFWRQIQLPEERKESKTLPLLITIGMMILAIWLLTGCNVQKRAVNAAWLSKDRELIELADSWYEVWGNRDNGNYADNVRQMDSIYKLIIKK